MDRETIEDVVYASLGRHLRVTCVLGLLFLAIGFVLGHYVAAQHSRELSVRWASRVDLLSKQIDQVDKSLKAELGKVRELAQAHESAQKAAANQPPVVIEPSRNEELLNETRRLSRAAEEMRRTSIARCIEDIEREETRILLELQPYLDRKLTIQAAEVSKAVTRLVNTQVAQLKTLVQVETPPTPAVDVSYFRNTDISPVSAETDDPHCPVPEYHPLIPVADDQAQSDLESVALVPMPSPAAERLPAPAEPSSGSLTKSKAAPQFFSAPRKPRLFITGRKPLEISSEKESVIR